MSASCSPSGAGSHTGRGARRRGGDCRAGRRAARAHATWARPRPASRWCRARPGRSRASGRSGSFVSFKVRARMLLTNLPAPRPGVKRAGSGLHLQALGVRTRAERYRIAADAPGRKDRDRDRRRLGHGPGRRPALCARRRASRGGGLDSSGVDRVVREIAAAGGAALRHPRGPDHGTRTRGASCRDGEPLQGARLRLEPRRPSRARPPSRASTCRRSDLAIDLNLRTVLVTTEAAIPEMRARGGGSLPLHRLDLRAAGLRVQPRVLDVQVRRGRLRAQPGRAAGPREDPRERHLPRAHRHADAARVRGAARSEVDGGHGSRGAGAQARRRLGAAWAAPDGRRRSPMPRSSCCPTKPRS